MSHPLAMDGKNRLHSYKAPADALNKQKLTADKEWTVTTTTKCHARPWMWVFSFLAQAKPTEKGYQI